MGVADPRTIGEVVKFLRVRSGLSLKAVGDAVGMSENTVRKYEQDDEFLTPDRLQVLGRIVLYLAGQSDETFARVWADIRRMRHEQLEQLMLDVELEVTGVPPTTDKEDG